MVDGVVAATEPIVLSMNVEDILKFKKSFLRSLHPEMDGNRSRWQRFVLFQVDAREGMSMYPRLLPGATVLIDRHYNSLKPYRKEDGNMYAVNRSGACTLKYVEVAGRQLVLRPHNQAYPVEVVPLPEGKRPADYLIGRVCYLGMET